MNYVFELYDHYVGQFVAMNYRQTINHRNTVCAAPGTVPENTRFLSGAFLILWVVVHCVTIFIGRHYPARICLRDFEQLPVANEL